jgi:hypothetical protein
MTASALDIVVLVLLVVTCIWCYLLNRRLQGVRDGQASLERAIADFDAATRRAEDSLAKIEREGATTGRALSAVITRAGALEEDLSVMVASAERAADRLEGALVTAKAAGRGA